MKDFIKGIKRCDLDINVTFEFLTDNREKDTTCSGKQGHLKGRISQDNEYKVFYPTAKRREVIVQKIGSSGRNGNVINLIGLFPLF